MALQQSEEGATRNGIQALQMAYTGVQRCQQDVQSTRNNLGTSYGGSDGGAFGKLLDQWDQNVDTILLNLDRMVDELNETLREHGLTQGASNDAIVQQQARSSTVFDGLTPA
ncbi:WXG100 family type VII secretion target [Streptomyces sp. NEAU-W12]|uniref:WXG100 family type VII secretion target n=1 Tax=Streptomyces sp. NEAU-W12 TaxID=2994668 RepID=UPI00224AD354|nr:WXG100 family type VII secretion target [Streptomyces sp. NEAU-W12]MCX2923467.1 WXG100 family type VII secretion target [Streptomyces sp. NEAU-W12]